MTQKRTTTIDLDRIFGAQRPQDLTRLLGPSPASTFDRVKAHSVKGCCYRHDDLRNREIDFYGE